MSILSYQATGQCLGGAAARGSVGRLTRKGVLDSQLCPEQHRPDKCHCNVARILQSQKGGLNCHSPVPPRSPKSLFRKTHLTIPFKEKLWYQRKLDMKTDPFPIIPFSNKADMWIEVKFVFKHKERFDGLGFVPAPVQLHDRMLYDWSLTRSVCALDSHTFSEGARHGDIEGKQEV